MHSLVKNAAYISCAVALSCAAPIAQAKDYVVGYAGLFDVLRGDSTPQFGLEYRMGPWNFGVRPTVGVNVDTDGGAYGYGGINWDIPLPHTAITLTPNFMVGGYHQGGSKDLGGSIEFRSGLEASYQLPNEHRIGIAFNHISNASIYNRNPGAETLLINYQAPIDGLFNWRR